MKNLWYKHSFNAVTAIVVTILLLLQSVPVFADTVLPGEYHAVVESIYFSDYSECARFPEYASHETWEEKTKAENERVCFENEEYGGSLAFDDGLCVELSHNYTSTLLSTFYTPISVYNLFIYKFGLY